MAVYYQNNKDKYVKKDKSKSREAVRRHYRNHAEEYKARAVFRKAAKICATPEWLTEADKKEMIETYKRAKTLSADGVCRHVDHIIPLLGENVCGLHVPWNLQILTEEENLSKGNRIVQQ
jgi:5-methylcytosine-specific restriction endonuclease McrA